MESLSAAIAAALSLDIIQVASYLAQQGIVESALEPVTERLMSGEL